MLTSTPLSQRMGFANCLAPPRHCDELFVLLLGNKIIKAKPFIRMKQQRNKPVFTHPEIEALYQYDFAIPREKVEAILQLPRESLIEDLRKVLRDSIDNFDFFRERGWTEQESDFVMHAFWLLADLKDESTLEDVLEVLRQDSDYLDYWFNDFLTEDLWEVIFHIGGNSLERLKSFALEPEPYTFAKIAVCTAVEQIPLHQPSRREEVVEWYRSIFEHFLSLEENDPLLDGDYIASIASDIISFEGSELIPLVQRLDDKGLLFHGIAGTAEDIAAWIEKGGLSRSKRPVYSSIFDRYQKALKTWHYYRIKYDEDYRERNKSPKRDPMSHSEFLSRKGTFQRTKSKVGRNAPCPCGSGKKYKRCCGQKGKM